MKIACLELKAFGPFTDKIIDFASDAFGMHIIYGPNEAGKSSSLRALKAWLFGFPERTGDNFKHPNDRLLIAGSLASEDGQTLYFTRRKKRKADMLDIDGNPLQPDRLSLFLPVSNQAVFESLYGIDHNDLIQGGIDILAQKGEIGQALFAAGAGISSLNQIIRDMETRAEELFKIRGSKQKINQSIAEFKELQKAISAQSLSGRRWKELQSTFEKANQDLDIIEQQRAVKAKQRRQLERLKQSLPLIVLRKNLQQEIKSLGEVKVLPKDFAQKKQTVETQLHTAKENHALATERQLQLQKNIESIALNVALLNQETSIENLHQRSGEYQKAGQDRPKLEGMRIAAKTQAAQYLQMVRPDLSVNDAQTLRPVFAKRNVMQTLIRKHTGLLQQADNIERQAYKNQQDLKHVHDMLSSLSQIQDNPDLLNAVKLARKAGDIDDVIGQMENSLNAQTTVCHQEIKRLLFWQGNFNALLELRLPLEKSIDQFEDDFAKCQTMLNDLDKEKRRLENRQAEIAARIMDLEYGDNIPSEQDLLNIRILRDQGWALIKRQWIDSENIEDEISTYHKDLPLDQAYEKNVTQADLIADRLRREADRVHQYTSLKAEQQTLINALSDLTQKQSRIFEDKSGIDTAWQALWAESHIQPKPPKEMRAFLAQITTIRDKVADIQKTGQELGLKKSQRALLKKRLLEQLKEDPDHMATDSDTLAPLLIHAETVLETTAKQIARKQQLIDRQADLEKDRHIIQNDKAFNDNALCQWNQNWQEAVSGLYTGNVISPEQADSLIEHLTHCFEKLKEVSEFEKRIQGIDIDLKRFETDLSELVKTVAPELTGQPSEQAIFRLKSMLNQARSNQALLEKYRKEMVAVEKEVRQNQVKIDQGRQQSKDLCDLAGKASFAELESAWQVSDRYSDLLQRLSETEALLIKSAEGMTIDEIEAQAKDMDPDTLAEQIHALTQDIEKDLDPRIKVLSETIGETRTELGQMDGNANAAQLSEKNSQVLARLQRLTDHYIKLKMASWVLKKEIEKFRMENQSPVFKIASDYFTSLTLKSFSGLRADEDDSGNAVLVGIKPDDSRIHVDQMSSGTRDQLYLALRLAFIKWRLASSQSPMPFIVDDILINFDDDRSLATLTALSDLAAATQVILFTHHAKIIEQVAAINHHKNIYIHRL